MNFKKESFTPNIRFPNIYEFSVGRQNVYGKKKQSLPLYLTRVSITGVFLWILRNLSKLLSVEYLWMADFDYYVLHF